MTDSNETPFERGLRIGRQLQTRYAEALAAALAVSGHTPLDKALTRAFELGAQYGVAAAEEIRNGRR
jgi:Mg-chelatase subunit ChlD